MRAIAEAPPSVSVIIAAYNAEPFIERAIKSALDQTGVILEIVVVDDASTDGTAAKVLCIAQDDSRVRLVSLPINKGPAAARNAAISAAQHDWLAILDADDAFSPARLKHLVQIAIAEAADIIADNFRLYDAASGTVSEPQLCGEPTQSIVAVADFLSGARPNVNEADFGLLKPIFNRRYFLENGLAYPEDVHHAEDFELIFEALMAGARYCLVRSEAYYIYTTRDSGWSRTRVDYLSVIKRTVALQRANSARLNPALFEERILAQFEHVWLMRKWGKLNISAASILATALICYSGRSWMLGKLQNKLRLR